MAEVKIGDKVKFLNDVGGGTVVEIIDKHLVRIRTDDDWDIPALKTELLVEEAATEIHSVSPVKSDRPSIEKHRNESDEKNKAEKEITTFIQPQPTDISDKDILVLTGFLPANPNDPLNCDLEIYLINDSSYSVLFNYVMHFDGNYFSRETGVLEADTKYLLESVPRENLNQVSGILLQIIYFSEGHYVPHSPIEKHLKIYARKFYKEGSLKLNDYFDHPAIILNVFNSLDKKINQLSKEEISTAIKSKKDQQLKVPPRKIDIELSDDEMIVDLHIHELVDDHSRMSNSEINDLQMNAFRKAMDDAIKNRKRKLILVHGIGQGKLKYDLRMELERDFKNFPFQDASFKEYGYGATLVYIRQNFRKRK